VTVAVRMLAVIVPARDEERTLPRCLSALAAAEIELRRRHGAHAPKLRVVVVLDRCVDDTALVAAQYPVVETVMSVAGLVGAARAQGVRHVLSSTDVPARQIWLANTDADSRVPLDWLCVQFEAGLAGESALLGAVRPDADGLPAVWLADYLKRHPLREDHGNVHGANLGVRADHYLAVGGFPALSTAEDVALVRALELRGLRPRSSARGAVITSSRLVGRAPDGYAEYLREAVG
jgi:glycosyltransferase involved in cell wall biosynthesis